MLSQGVFFPLPLLSRDLDQHPDFLVTNSIVKKQHIDTHVDSRLPVTALPFHK